MQESTEAKILHESTILTTHQRVVRILLLLAILILTFIIGYDYFTVSDTQSIAVPVVADELYNEVKVDTALSFISTPPPPASDAEDLAAYQDYLSEPTVMYASHMAGEEVFTTANLIDQFYAVNPRFDQTKFENHPQANWLRQIESELVVTTVRLHESFDRAAPDERFTEISNSPIPHIPTQTIYPNVQAVLMFYYAEFFTKLDPDNRLQYELLAENTVKSMVMVGHISASDVAYSKLVAKEYMEILENQTNFEIVLLDLSTN